MENSLMSDALWTSRICLYVFCCHFIHLCHCFKAMLLVGIFPSQGLPTLNSFFTPCPERPGGVLQMSSDTDDRMGAKIKTLKKFPQTPNPPKNPMVDLWALKISRNHITRKIPKKILAKFSYSKKSWNQKFQLQKILRSSLHLKFGVPPGDQHQ